MQGDATVRNCGLLNLLNRGDDRPELCDSRPSRTIRMSFDYTCISKEEEAVFTKRIKNQ